MPVWAPRYRFERQDAFFLHTEQFQRVKQVCPYSFCQVCQICQTINDAVTLLLTSPPHTDHRTVSAASRFCRAGAGLVLLAAALWMASCTTYSWTVEPDQVPDESERELLDTAPHIAVLDSASVERPVLELELLDVHTYRYPERLEIKRYVQRYRPRYGFMALALGGAAAGFYAANAAGDYTPSLSRNERIAVNTGSALLALSPLLGMKPVDEGEPTGESRLLNRVGEHIQPDTVRTQQPQNCTMELDIYLDGDQIRSGWQGTFEDGVLAVDLVDDLGIDRVEGAQPGDITLEGELEGQHYRFTVPVASFLQQFVEITRPNVPVRNEPEQTPENIMTHVGMDSQLPLQARVEEEWFEVLYGISSSYIEDDDGRLIWRTGEQDELDDLLIDPDEVAFGDLALESEVPQSDGERSASLAVVIANEHYPEPLTALSHAPRTVELVRLYLEEAMGYPQENIIVLRNASPTDMNSLLQQTDSLSVLDRTVDPDRTDLFFYYMGHARADGDQAWLLSSDYHPDRAPDAATPLSDVLQALGRVETRSTTAVLETDFSAGSAVQPRRGRANMQDLMLREAAQEFLADRPQAALFLAANRGQLAGRYRSPDGRENNQYGIFTYFFFDAIRQGLSTANDLQRHLERNVDYTSRRLFDRGQSPRFFGEPELPVVR